MATTKIPAKALGRNGPLVSTIGFGAMGLSASYGSGGSDEDRFRVLDRAHELGSTFWDTADVYGDNEELIGKWFKRTGKRDDIFLATKCGGVFGASGSASIRSDPEYVRQACDKSLQLLGVSHIDLFYLHRLDKETPVELTVNALAGLKELVYKGKIRHLGLCEVSAATLRRAHAVHPITAIQVEYSPFSVEIEKQQTELLNTARELGIAVVAYSPLGRGMLTGQIKSPDDFAEDDFRKSLPRFSKENFPKNLALVEKIGTIAASKGVMPGQLTLAWLLAQGSDIFPIPGTKKIKYLEENLGAVSVALTRDEEAEIRKAIDETEVIGGRYSDVLSDHLFADTPALGA
ncbi:aldo keto reductase [Trichoderma arundinaceum]|uniref:Aldo keto reductase n=1 Tax=Trichoderma arundinaceum TaxID=490622 RepID=A0A395NNA2_TRIAR|nr:aldo keto reductase [Trichoderma arundinaceum]